MDNESKLKDLTAQLENIFTIDGRGRPRKCKNFLELLRNNDINIVMKEIEKMSEIKFF